MRGRGFVAARLAGVKCVRSPLARERLRESHDFLS